MNFLEDALEQAEADLENLEDLQEDAGVKTEKDLLKLQMDAQFNQLQRPVYITYGVGSNLRDWAPPQCFEKVHKVEYNFDGTGARTIKLFYTAIGIHPNLSQMGISPLGVLGMGTQTQGRSQPIFNVDARKKVIETLKKISNAQAQNMPEEQNTDLKGLGKTVSELLTEEDYAAGGGADTVISKAVGSFWFPSIHVMLKQAITSYIQAGTNYENVLVILPNLDKMLGAYLYHCWDEVVDGMPWNSVGGTIAEILTFGMAGTSVLDENEENMAGFAMIRDALEGLGLQMSEARTFADANTLLGPVGENVWESLEECDDPKEAFKWLSTREFCATVHCDNVTKTFQGKLAEIGKCIVKKVSEFNEFAPTFHPHLQVETDLNMLRLFRDAGLLSADSWKKPTIIWGDRDTIMNFLEARIMEQPLRKFKTNVSDQFFNNAPKHKEVTIGEQVAHEMAINLHPYDIFLGLDQKYMDSVLEYSLPVPWIGPWVGAGNPDDLVLEDDPNILTEGQSKGLEDLKKSQPMKTKRMPVFSFGTKNPNILDIDIDINAQYMDLINNAAPATVPNQQMVNAIIPKKYQSMANTMFANIADLNVDEYDENIYNKMGEKVPRGFKPLVEDFFDSDWFSGDDVDMGEEWEEIFNNLGPEEYKGLDDGVFKGSGKSFHGSDTKEQFFVWMWKAFKDLMMQTYVPTSEQNTGGKNASKSVQAKNSQIASRMARHALQGSIRTLPLFNLASVRRAIRRACLLYCIEPRFFLADKGGVEAAHTTWFSGVYDIVGFEHTISKSAVDSKFKIARSPVKGGQLTEG